MSTIIDEKNSSLLNASLKLCQNLTDTKWGMKEQAKLFLKTPISDYIVHKAPMGGFVPHDRKKLRKRNFFI